ncbi:MAG: RluA family pseudouridine synthase, partial [Spirochaetaceae bacterium]|nr:RluA family pseudouridine synthase [Spirochaetaceae bacterium]
MEKIPSERILYDDPCCLVINKEVGEAVEGAGRGMTDLLALLRAEGFPHAEAVHRLDVPVSGCALFAKTADALASLNRVFAEGRAVKKYWAITEDPAAAGGTGPAGEGELLHWIASDAGINKSRAFDSPGPGRKEARLRYRCLGRGIRYLFLEIELITGRHHQIRAQLAAIGLHIKGDLKYGSRRSEKGGGIRLHARSLAFPHPDTGQIVSVSALPRMDPLWEAL